MIEDLLNPKAIAVIGASTHPEKIGFAVLKNIIDGGFKGRLFPINPDAENIIGLKCYPTVIMVPFKIDVAVIVVPAEVVAPVLTECGKKGIKFAIIISAGFAEIGAEGGKRQETIEKIAKVYGIKILGPNCLGLIDPINHLNISFGNNLVTKKDIAVVSQSGATCTAILDWANEKGVGFSHFVSLGNKAGLDENDFLLSFKNDPKTKVVLSYLESITNGPKLLKLAKELTKKKPLIILKAGRSQTGQKAASSHTGALAGDDLVLQTAFDEAGIIRAETAEDLFEWGMTFSNLEISDNGKVLIITNAGGPAVMATDAISFSSSLSFYELADKEKSKIKNKLPKNCNLGNPLDLLGDATSQRFETVLDELKEDGPDYKLVLLTPQVNTDIEKIAKLLVKFKDKKTVVVLLGGERFIEAEKILSEARIPFFLYPERAVIAIDRLVKYARYKKMKHGQEVYPKVFAKVADKVLRTKDILNDSDIAKIFESYNIPMANSFLTKDINEATRAAEEVGYPVVLKVTSPDILHKTEVGAVKLGIENEEDLKISYQEVLGNAKKHFPKANILGVTVYRMVRSTVEVAIGARRDPVFGPVIMFGMGGIYIELLKDFKLGLAPVSEEKAFDMIKRINSYEILNGFRNGKHLDVKAIAKAISGLSLLMSDFPQIREIDINPIRVNEDGHGILALDGKIILEKEKILVS